MVEAAGWGRCAPATGNYDADEDCYYISLRNLSTILKVSRPTGRILWQIGGAHSDFAFPGPRMVFSGQHRFRRFDGHLLVFDNDGIDGMLSRAVEYVLDTEHMVARPVWSYVSDPPIWTVALGDVERLPSGNTLVNWGAAGQLDEVTPAGELVRRINTPLGNAFGFHEWVEDLNWFE